MNRVAELEQQLEQARKDERSAALAYLTVPFTGLENRCFLYGYQAGGKFREVGLVRYSDFKCQDSFAVYYRSRTIYANANYSYYHTSGFSRKDDKSCFCSHYSDLINSHINEVSLEDFEALWKEPAFVGATMLEKLLAEYKSAEALPSSVPFVEDIQELDVPYIKLSGMESSITGTTVWNFRDDLYLVTPNSKLNVIKNIMKDRERDARCAHLYAACDSAYLTRRQEATDSLCTKLGIRL